MHRSPGPNDTLRTNLVFHIPSDPFYQLYHRFDPSLYSSREQQLAEVMRRLQKRHRGVKLWAIHVTCDARMALLGHFTLLGRHLPREVVDIILSHLFISWIHCTGSDRRTRACHVFRPCRYCGYLRCGYCDVKYYDFSAVPFQGIQQCNCVRRLRRSRRVEERRARMGLRMHDTGHWPHQAPLHAAFPLLYPDELCLMPQP